MCEGVDWVHLAEDMDEWPALVEHGNRIRGFKKADIFLEEFRENYLLKQELYVRFLMHRTNQTLSFYIYCFPYPRIKGIFTIT